MKNVLRDTRDHNYYITHCRTEPIINTFAYTWSISKFWDTYNFVNSLDSCPLSHLLIKFRMEIIKAEDKLKFYIVSSQNNEKPIVVLCDVYLKTVRGKALHKLDIKCKFQDAMLLFEVPVSLLREGSQKYLLANMLTVCFNLHIFRSAAHSIASKSIICPRKMVKKHVLLSIDKNEVVSLITSDTRCITINKALLCSKSSVFQDIFRSNTETYIHDVSYSILEMICTFIETGIPPNINISSKNIQSLLIAADKYLIRDLKTICAHHLIRKITIQNVVKLLDFAYTYRVNVLKEYAHEVIRVYYEKIADKEEFSQLVEKYPDLSTISEKIQFNSHSASYT